jgi:CNT family concentrative nucleoside transporter
VGRIPSVLICRNPAQRDNGIVPLSAVSSTFALCGFANFSSIAIQIGGISALAPLRLHDVSSLGVKALLAGTLTNFLSACIAGVIL